jgi:ribosome-binding factor A
VLKALQTHTAYFQKEVAARLKLKYAAKIKFTADESFDVASKIDRLLNDPRVSRDLGAGTDETGD